MRPLVVEAVMDDPAPGGVTEQPPNRKRAVEGNALPELLLEKVDGDQAR
jgi:hypothetical protein